MCDVVKTADPMRSNDEWVWRTGYVVEVQAIGRYTGGVFGFVAGEKSDIRSNESG